MIYKNILTRDVSDFIHITEFNQSNFLLQCFLFCSSSAINPQRLPPYSLPLYQTTESFVSPGRGSGLHWKPFVCGIGFWCNRVSVLPLLTFLECSWLYRTWQPWILQTDMVLRTRTKQNNNLILSQHIPLLAVAHF